MITLALLLAFPDVLDVDANQGPYFEIRDAVAAAAPGDVVRVAPGSYGWFGVFGKTLTVASGDPTGAVNVIGSVRVQNLAADQRVVLSGLTIEREVGMVTGDDPLILAGNLGSVRVQDCAVDGVTGLAVRIQQCEDVTFEGSAVVAGAYYSTFFGGSFSANALEAFDSNLSTWDSEFHGSDASVWSVDGGTGLYASTCDLLVHGVTATGGNGGPDDYQAFTGMCRPAGWGGNGVTVIDGTLRVLDSSLTGGLEGDPSCCGGFGGPGEPYVAHNSSVDLIPGSALELDCAALSLEGSPYDIDAAGDPGDIIVLVIGPDTARVDVPAYTGDLHVGGPIGGARRAMLGVGSVQAQLQLPPLPAFTTAGLYLQTVHLRSGTVVFGPTRSLTILDSGW